jgi:hypothetical protein
MAVFLRVLEYYSGILFLTTNRVGAFDEAFKSRIHISLYYPPLDEESTIKVWDMNLQRTKRRKENFNFRINRKEILAFAKDHYRHEEEGRWNGRQIRNAFQTAIALAEYDAHDDGSDDEEATGKTRRITLRKDHFETVAKASLDFDQYLQEVYGGVSASDRAFDNSNRYDQYGMTNSPIPGPSDTWYGEPRGNYSAPRGYDRHGQPGFSPPVSRGLDRRRSVYNEKPIKFPPPRPSKPTREREPAKKAKPASSGSDTGMKAANESNVSVDADPSDSQSESESETEVKKRKKAAAVKEKERGKEKEREREKEKKRKGRDGKETKGNKEKRGG